MKNITPNGLFPLSFKKFFLYLHLLIVVFLLSGCRGGDLWSGVNNGDLFDESDAKIDEVFDELAKANMRVLRIWIDFRLEMDHDGNALPVGTYNDCILDEIDNLMVKAKKKGILLLPVLQQHNWIGSKDYSVNEANVGWKNCRTPINVYHASLSEGTINVKGPYYQRGWSEDYLTNRDAKNAYKQRVHHILNHVNPHFGLAWKDIDDVIWAWGLQNEPEYLIPGYVPKRGGDTRDLKIWFNEMATYVKSIDPDTYVALGTMDFNASMGNIVDADIYTLHVYQGLPGHSLDALQFDIDRFKSVVGDPYNKLLLLEEFNVYDTHTPGTDPQTEFTIEKIMELSRKNKIPWMLWEHGYYFDSDDIWHGNGLVDGKVVPDGVYWGSKLLPGALRIWNDFSFRLSTQLQWDVHPKTDNLCALPGAACDNDRRILFLDLFSGNDPSQLSNNYVWFDERTATFPEDSYDLLQGYLNIYAGLGQDLWGGGPPYKRGAPMLVYPAPNEDYMVESFVKADFSNPPMQPTQPINTQIGLFVFDNVHDWIFFGLTHHEVDGEIHDGLIVGSTQADSSSVIAEMPLEDDFVFLKISKWGNRWNFYWKSENAQSWQFLTSLTQTLSPEHYPGMGVKTFDFEHPQLYGPTEANFDYFLIEAYRPEFQPETPQIPPGTNDNPLFDFNSG